MTDEKLKQLVERLAVAQEETDRFIKAPSKQMGELDRKLGGYTEGLAVPAMKKILHRRVKMNVITERALAHKNGQSLEVDMLGVSNQEHGDAQEPIPRG